MHIRWNPTFKQFETHARTSSLSQDVDALKSSRWQTEGPPDWLWVAFRADHLIKLKKIIPTGLTVSPEALENFTRLKDLADKNAKVKADLKAHKKELGKQEDLSKGFQYVMGPEGFPIAVVEPEESQIKNKFVPPAPFGKCHICQIPIYNFECQDPPMCLDCEFDSGL